MTNGLRVAMEPKTPAPILSYSDTHTGPPRRGSWQRFTATAIIVLVCLPPCFIAIRAMNRRAAIAHGRAVNMSIQIRGFVVLLQVYHKQHGEFPPAPLKDSETRLRAIADSRFSDFPFQWELLFGSQTQSPTLRYSVSNGGQSALVRDVGENGVDDGGRRDDHDYHFRIQDGVIVTE